MPPSRRSLPASTSSAPSPSTSAMASGPRTCRSAGRDRRGVPRAAGSPAASARGREARRCRARPGRRRRCRRPRRRRVRGREAGSIPGAAGSCQTRSLRNTSCGGDALRTTRSWSRSPSRSVTATPRDGRRSPASPAWTAMRRNVPSPLLLSNSLGPRPLTSHRSRSPSWSASKSAPSTASMSGRGGPHRGRHVAPAAGRRLPPDRRRAVAEQHDVDQAVVVDVAPERRAHAAHARERMAEASRALESPSFIGHGVGRCRR